MMERTRSNVLGSLCRALECCLAALAAGLCIATCPFEFLWSICTPHLIILFRVPCDKPPVSRRYFQKPPLPYRLVPSFPGLKDATTPVRSAANIKRAGERALWVIGHLERLQRNRQRAIHRLPAQFAAQLSVSFGLLLKRSVRQGDAATRARSATRTCCRGRLPFCTSKYQPLCPDSRIWTCMQQCCFYS